MKLEEIEKKEYIDKGDFSKCYDIGNHNVLKLFNNSMSIADIHKFKYLLKYRNESFLFPFEFVYDEENFYGYITKRSLGKKIISNFSSLDIEKLSTHSILLEHNIKKISEAKISIDDMNGSNILYDGKKIEVIDPDFYWIDKETNTSEIQKRNLNSYKNTILVEFRANIGYYKKTNYVLQKILKYEYMPMTASTAMIKIKEDMEKYYKEEINTIDDLHNIARR